MLADVTDAGLEHEPRDAEPQILSGDAGKGEAGALAGIGDREIGRRPVDRQRRRPRASPTLKADCVVAALGVKTTVCVPVTVNGGNCVVVPSPHAFPCGTCEPFGSAIV